MEFLRRVHKRLSKKLRLRSYAGSDIENATSTKVLHRTKCYSE